jgi:hypothetical protein
MVLWCSNLGTTGLREIRLGRDEWKSVLDLILAVGESVNVSKVAALEVPALGVAAGSRAD